MFVTLSGPVSVMWGGLDVVVTERVPYTAYTVMTILMVFVVVVRQAGMDWHVIHNATLTVNPMVSVDLCIVIKRLVHVRKAATQVGMEPTVPGCVVVPA